MPRRLSFVRLSLAVLLLLLPTAVRPQVSIGGHRAPFDSLTAVWLATVPEQVFGQDSTLSIKLAPTCRMMTIGQDTITPAATGHHRFLNICADSTYSAALTDNQGNTVCGHVMFTFMPVVVLEGDFGYNYTDGTLLIANPGQGKDDTYHAQVKWRGGTTNAANKHKRNYKVKLDGDASLLGLRSDNSWMLDAGQPDVFRMRNRIAMDLWNDIARQPYYHKQEKKARNGVSGRMVELFLGNEYRGIYNFSEFIDRKQMKLRKADETTGLIRGCLYKGFSWEDTQMFNPLTTYDNTKETLRGYEVKYPDLADCDTIDWAPLVRANNYAISCSDVDFEEHIADYFDIPVLVDYSLFLGIVNAVDNSGKNMYWAIYDKEAYQRLTPAPWDLDATFGQRWGGQLVGGKNDFASPSYMTDVDVFVFYRFYMTNAAGFNDQLNERYRELSQPGGPLTTDSLIGRVTHYYNMVTRSGAARREAAKWSGDSDVWGDVIDFDSEYAYICEWITNHMDIVNNTTFPLYYNQTYFDELSIAPVVANSHANSRPVYDLMGRRQTAHGRKPGIYIQQGRKIIVTQHPAENE